MFQPTRPPKGRQGHGAGAGDAGQAGPILRLSSGDDPPPKGREYLGTDPEKYILRIPHSPGDVLVATAALRSLALTYPGRFAIQVDSCAGGIFDHSPDVVRGLRPDGPEVRRAEWHYPLVNESNTLARHFSEAHHESLADILGVPLRPKTNRPWLWLSEEETGWVSQVQEITGKPTPFAVVVAGGKTDFTTKLHAPEFYQAIIDSLRGRVQFVQVGEAGHDHPDLRGVIDLRGRTDTRQLTRLCWHARFGIGPSTFVQHIFAAHARPYLCIHRAAEPLSWITYPTQHVLSRLGGLDCCREKACWKSRTVPLGDGKSGDDSLCEQPVFGFSRPVPRCLVMIRPDEAVRVVEDWISGGVVAFS